MKPHVSLATGFASIISIGRMLMKHAMPLGNLGVFLVVPIEDKTSRKHVSLSGPIPLSVPEANENMRIVVTG